MNINLLKSLIISIIFFISINSELQAQLKSYDNQADYIVITPSQFDEALQPFVEWRQQKNLNLKLVEIQQIYSEFPDSTLQSSIRDFVSYSLTYWNNPKPKYILLVGGKKLLPSYWVRSMFSPDTSFHEDSVSIDELYSVNSYDSDFKPDVDIGRFPVNNEQELNNIIRKTMYFEDSLSFKDYPKDFIFLTDKTDFQLFKQSANRFINTTLPLNFSMDTIFAGQDSTIELSREHLFSDLNKGTMLLSYYGHGAPDRWSKYNIFTSKDVDSLSKNNLPFILASAACEQPFDSPNDSTIVRKLIISQNNGTVASINSTGLNYLNDGSNFLIEFYSTVFSNPGISIGDALLQTKLYFEHNSIAFDAIPRRYTLLGDPALKLHLNVISQIKSVPKNIPDSYTLKQNYPNPFNPNTTIEYSISKESFVRIKVYDILGKEIRTLVNERKHSGNYSVKFNAGNLPSGIIFIGCRPVILYQQKN